MTKPSKLPWSVETCENQCEDGPVTTWCIADADGRVIFDALNAEDAELHVEHDGDPNGFSTTVDLLSKANAELIVAAVNATRR
jgi:hypothetical protein